jgi:predicted acyl esterase
VSRSESASHAAVAAHRYVELLAVAPDGTESLVGDGFLAAGHRDSDVEPEPAPVGEEVSLKVDVRPAHHRFVAGHTVRVRISDGGSTRLTDPPAPVEISVATGASTLRLPGFRTPAGD